MTSEAYRACTIKIEDGGITTEKTLLKAPIHDIFQFNTAPYIIIGAPGSGKTTLCLDIINSYCRECTKIYYVTATEENPLNDGKSGNISLIPRVFRRKPTYENLNGIWEDMNREITAHIYNADVYIRLLKKIWGDKELTKVQTAIKNLNEKKDNLKTKQEAFYREKKMSETEANDLAIDDSNAFYCECLSRMLVDSAMQNNTSNLTMEEMLVLNSLVSQKPKTLLILDDVTSELSTLSTQRRTVLYKGVSTKAADAYKSILTDILTRSRHTDSLICLFLHTIDLIPRDQISNLVLLDEQSVPKIKGIRSFTDDMRKIIVAAAPHVFRPELRYHFLAILRSIGQYSVGKAEVISQPLTFSKVNNELVKTYDLILKSVDGETLGVEDDNDDSDSGEEEESDEDSSSEGF